MEDIKLALDSDGHLDIVFEDGDIATCTEDESVAVQIMERLLLTRVESLLNPLVDTIADPLAGTNWYGTVLDSSQDKIVGELEIKRVILGTPGVLGITKWSPTWPSSSDPGHTMTLSARVSTIYGDVDLNSGIGV